MEQQRIVVADDDPNVLELLSLYLEKENYLVSCARDGMEAMEEIDDQLPDLVILDIMMPRMNGWKVCREIKQRGLFLPVILLTAKSEDHDKILGLELGADDYVTKPFNPAEVVARVKAVLRRARENPFHQSADKVLNYPDLEISLRDYQVRLEGKVIDFTPKELELLWFLAKNPNQVFNRSQLLDRVWGYSYVGDIRTVDVHIKKIRKKFEGQGDYPWQISTVWGVGYKFEVKDSV